MTRDFDLAVIGGGTAGLISAMLAAQVGARIVLVERERTGGDCLWTGCVPSKALIESANLVHRMRHADAVGLDPVAADVDLARILDRVRAVQRQIEPQDSPERLRSLGVDVVHGSARFIGPRRVQLDGSGRGLTARVVLVATGAQPVVPPVDGLAEAGPLTSDTVWGLAQLPARLVVLGGGAIGCELAQAFARLGSAVTMVEMADRLLPNDDPQVGALLHDTFVAEGITVRTSTRCVAATTCRRCCAARTPRRPSRRTTCSSPPDVVRAQQTSAWTLQASRCPSVGRSASTRGCAPRRPASTPQATSPGGCPSRTSPPTR